MPRDRVLTKSLNKLRDDVQSMVSARADRIMEGLSKSITDAFVNNVQKRLISRATPKDTQSAMLVQNIADSIVVDESVWAGKYEYRIVIPRDPEGLVMFLEFGTGLVGYTQGNPDATKYGWSYAVNRNSYVYKKHEGRLGFIFEKTGTNYIDRDDESPNISVKQYTPTKQWGGGFTDKNGRYVKRYRRARNRRRDGTLSPVIKKYQQDDWVFSEGLYPLRYFYDTKMEFKKLLSDIGKIKRFDPDVFSLDEVIADIERIKL